MRFSQSSPTYLCWVLLHRTPPFIEKKLSPNLPCSLPKPRWPWLAHIHSQGLWQWCLLGLKATGLHKPVGPYQTQPYWEAEGHLQSSQEDRRWVRNTAYSAYDHAKPVLYGTSIQSNEKTRLRSYKEAVDGELNSSPETYTNITGCCVPSPGHHATSHTTLVQLAVCDRNIKDMGCSQENFTELAPFLSLKYLPQHFSHNARLIILGSSEYCVNSIFVQK